MQANKRMRESGFSRTRGGYTFEGADHEKIKEATLFKKLLKINKKLKEPKDPKMKIPPLDPEGGAGVGFN